MSAEQSDAILARMMALHPRVIDLTLGRVWRLLAALGSPERRLPPVIHIAGTNAKGSVLAMLRAGLEGAGARVHAYTSPHLVRFHERIRVAGTLIPEGELSAILDECERANGAEPITYFEITTCAALLAFARRPAEWTLLEVGLGGRLDATNVVDRPALSVITPVAMDHQAYLGDSLARIAAEKAGILKPGVPAVIGPQHPEAMEVIAARAAEVGAPLHIHGRDWQVREQDGALVWQGAGARQGLPLPALVGRHQIDNAGIALAALHLLGAGDPAAAMRDAHWPGRMQRLSSGKLSAAAPGAEIWLDGGHNPEAAQAVSDAMAAMAPRPLHLICGMLNTKDIAGFMAAFAGRAAHLHAVAIPGEGATLSADATARAARDAGIPASAADGWQAAAGAIAAEAPGARILVTGSLYLAGRVLAEDG